MNSQFAITALDSTHDRGDFDCGEPSLNDYLKRFALQNAKQGLGRTWVAVEAGGVAVKGYYTLVSSSVSFDIVPKKLPRYPVPVILLARLAVDLRYQGQRFGADLLLDALERAAEVADEVGVYAVVLDALHDSAQRFYLKYGFEPLTDDHLHLYLPIKTIKQLFSK